MTERTDFAKKGEVILDFLDTYGAVKYEHLEKFFPYSKKIINYLLKNQRLHKSPDRIYISADENHRPDKCLIAALSVLVDVLEKVQSHARATAPVQISFITYSGDYYEIVYVGYGMEVMVSAFFETQLVARQRQKDNNGFADTDTAKRIVIVENKNQMERLQIPRIARFALIQPKGSLSYFKGS